MRSFDERVNWHRLAVVRYGNFRMRQLPPLKAICTFESAARHLSFKLASEELFVTQSAVSQQIKSLENYFGVSLFHRQPSGLALSEHGHRLLPSVVHALKILQDASTEISVEQSPISVSASTSFVMAWLMPRLRVFEQENADTMVNINASIGLMDNASPDVFDIIIRYDINSGERPGQRSILREWLLPVCEPEIRNEIGSDPVRIGDEHRLLLNSPDAADWRKWLQHFGCDQEAIRRILKLATSLPTDITAIEMAVGGYGVALANLHYVADRLSQGILVPAMDLKAFPLGAHFMFQNKMRQSGKMKRLVAWIESEALASDAVIETWL